MDVREGRSIKLTNTSKDIQSRIEMCDLYWKKFGSADEGARVVCYELRLKVLSDRTTLVWSNTRELDRVPKTKYSTLYTITHGPC